MLIFQAAYTIRSLEEKLWLVVCLLQCCCRPAYGCGMQRVERDRFVSKKKDLGKNDQLVILHCLFALVFLTQPIHYHSRVIPKKKGSELSTCMVINILQVSAYAECVRTGTVILIYNIVFIFIFILFYFILFYFIISILY